MYGEYVCMYSMYVPLGLCTLVHFCTLTYLLIGVHYMGWRDRIYIFGFVSQYFLVLWS